MKQLNKAQLVELGKNGGVQLFDLMESCEVTLHLSHNIIKGDAQITLDHIKGNTITIITKEFGPLEIFSHTYNNYTPHNFVALTY